MTQTARLRAKQRLGQSLSRKETWKLLDTIDELVAENARLAARAAELVEAARGLAEVLNRNGGKGPIPDVEVMFCWLAAQTVRAALAALEGRQ